MKFALSELNDLLGKFLASICPHIIDVKSCLEGSQALPNVVCTHRVRGTAVDPGLKEGEGAFSPSLFLCAFRQLCELLPADILPEREESERTRLDE